MTPSAYPTVRLFDCNVAALTLSQTVSAVQHIIEARIPTQHVVINASKVVLMEKDERLKQIVQACPLINADGQSIVWAAQLLGRPLPERVTGIDLMEELLALAGKQQYRVYFFGAKEEVVNRVADLYAARYPGLIVAGRRNGYFQEEDNARIIADIRQSRADILLVAFSSPKKEYWLAEHLQALGVPFCMGVGGSFDVAAGVTQRAPHWMQRTGLEWFYRFAQEPGRMWRRYLLGNTEFLKLVLREKQKHK